jgi:glycerophosphoryl diester phosphodiesterase
VIGHRGAGALAAPNSRAGLAAAVAAGADLVEFDLEAGLVLAHRGDPAAAVPLTLEAALRLLAPHPVGVEIDLKRPRLALELARIVAASGLEGRVAVSSGSGAALRRLARAAPGISRVLSLPRDPLGLGLRAWPARRRARLARRVGALLERDAAHALALRHELVSAELVAAVHAQGAALLAWTVNEPTRIGELAFLGVDAIVSDDPRMALEVVATLGGR